MALKMLLMVLAISMLLTSGTERSKEVSTRGRRLCLCSDRVLRLPSPQDSEASYSASCHEMCAFNSNAGVLLNDSRRHLRSRRDVLEEAKNCRFNKVHPHWPKLIIEVAFHRSENSSEWFAELSWSPFHGASHLWTGYYTLYSTGRWQSDKNLVKCQVMPKNQTSMNISSTADEETITINVAPLPKSLNSSVEYKDMILHSHSGDKPNYFEYDMQPSEKGTTPRPQPTFPPTSSDVPTKLIAVISGAASGFLLLVFAFLVYRKQISLWPCGKRDSPGEQLTSTSRNSNPSGTEARNLLVIPEPIPDC